MFVLFVCLFLNVAKHFRFGWTDDCGVRIHQTTDHLVKPQQIEKDFLVVKKDGSILTDRFYYIDSRKNKIESFPFITKDRVLYIFRTQGPVRKYYYHYPFIGKTTGTNLITLFPTMLMKSTVVNSYDLKKFDQYMDEYFEELLDNLPVLTKIYQQDPTTLPWPTTPLTQPAAPSVPVVTHRRSR